MGEIHSFSDTVKRVVKVEQKDTTTPGFSSVFKFPFTKDYREWMYTRLITLPAIGKRWTRFYLEIIRSQIEPAGIIIPSDWKDKLISYKTNCIYIIADENEEILYIGKSEFPAIVSLLDKMVPMRSERYPNGQSMNNVPQIWNDILSKGKQVKCFYCYDLGYDPEILKYYLLDEYKVQHGRLPIYNKKMPNNKVLDILDHADLFFRRC